MKTVSVGHLLWLAVISAFLSFSPPSFGQETDMLREAQDLVHQAWKPVGDPPSDTQRIDSLNQAIKLIHTNPDHRLQGHGVMAVRDIRAAIFEIKRGDPDNKVNDYLHDADSELRTALSVAN